MDRSKSLRNLVAEAAKTKNSAKRKPKPNPFEPPWVEIEDAHNGDGELNLRTHLRIAHGGGEVYSSSPRSNRIIHVLPDNDEAHIYDVAKDKNGNTTHVRHVTTLRGSYAGAGFR